MIDIFKGVNLKSLLVPEKNEGGMEHTSSRMQI